MRFRAFWLICAILAGHVQASWKAPREQLDRRLVSAGFSIYYTLEGEHAFAADVPAGKPRETEAAARLEALRVQLERADRFYREQLGLRPPFTGTRYADGQGIEIHILKLENKNGSTGDELHRFEYRHFPPRTRVLTIALSNRWLPTSLTPAHELFHVYQYSYTFFKNAWFLEGMARTSESFFRIKPAREGQFPATLGALDELLKESYSADRFWNHLLGLCGPNILRALLEAFDHQDDRAAEKLGIDRKAWPESAQRAWANNRYLLAGLRETLTATHCPSMPGNADLENLRSLINHWLNREASLQR